MVSVLADRQISESSTRTEHDCPRVCVISDCLTGNVDEGAKKLTFELLGALTRSYDVAVLSTAGPVLPTIAHWVCSSRTFISPALRSELRRLQPDVLIYATQRSATFFSFIRSRLLKSFCPQATVVLLGLQTRRHSAWQKSIIRHVRPDLVCVQSLANQQYLCQLGCAVGRLRSGVDTNKFLPVSATQRQALRTKYGLDRDKQIVLHVGHLKEARGVRVLAEIAAIPGYQSVLVTSTSTPQDLALGDELQTAGVVVFAKFLAAIEELYQLADCYVFPVESTDEAVEIPLSVLEALACDLPVVTTRFGGLPQLFQSSDNPSLVFVDDAQGVVAAAIGVAGAGPHTTRSLTQSFSWDAVASDLMDQALGVRESTTNRSRRSATVVTHQRRYRRGPEGSEL